MIRVRVDKLEMTGVTCVNPECKHLTEFHNNIFGQVYHIKPGTTCAFISIGKNRDVYCRSCIDDIYLMIKSKLDSKLWLFQ